MRYISVDALKENMKIAKTIYSNSGKIILPENITMNSELISKLKKTGISYFCIQDSRVDDVYVEGIIRYPTKFGTLKSIKDIYNKLFSAFQGVPDNQKESMVAEAANLIDVKQVFQNAQKMVEEVDRIGDIHHITSGKEILLLEVEKIEDYFAVHALNEAIISLALGKTQKLGKDSLVILLISALLSNIGMALVPDEILNKQDMLSPKEFMYVKNHPAYSCKILKENKNITPQILMVISQHHEKVDGTGYPKKLKSKDIHPFAKIIAIGDVYCSLISKRPYRNAYMPHTALEYILAGSGDIFDYDLVEKFSRIIPAYSKGIMVELNTGEKGCVVNPNKGAIARPIVRIFYDKDGKELNNLLEYDLTKPEHQTKIVVKVLDE